MDHTIFVVAIFGSPKRKKACCFAGTNSTASLLLATISMKKLDKLHEQIDHRYLVYTPNQFASYLTSIGYPASPGCTKYL